MVMTQSMAKSCIFSKPPQTIAVLLALWKVKVVVVVLGNFGKLSKAFTCGRLVSKGHLLSTRQCCDHGARVLMRFHTVTSSPSGCSLSWIRAYASQHSSVDVLLCQPTPSQAASAQDQQRRLHLGLPGTFQRIASRVRANTTLLLNTGTRAELSRARVSCLPFPWY